MQNYCACHDYVAPPSKSSCTAMYTPVFTPGVLPFAPAGQLKLFKIAPGDFVGGSRLVLAALITFCNQPAKSPYC